MRSLTTLAGILAALSAAPAGAAGLWEHFQSALAENAEYLEQVAAAERAEEQPRVRRSLLLPQISVSDRKSWTDGGENNDGGNNRGGEPDTETRTQSLSLRQSLFNLPDYLEYRAAQDSRDAAQLRAQSARSALIVRVAEAYFNGLWTKQQLGLTTARLRAVREQLSSITSGVSAGSATLLDQLRVQAELQAVVAEEIAARGDHELALRNLALVSGLDDEQIDPVTGAAPAAMLETEPEALRERASAGNLSVRALQAELAAAQTNTDAVRGAWLPKAEITAERMRTDGDLSRREYDTRTTILLQWTLFSGGGTQPAYRQALADLRAADIRLRGGIQAVSNETDRAINQIRNGESRVKALEASVEANEELLDIVTYGYEENINVLSDVFDAQKDLEDSKSQLARARYDLLLDSLRLLDVVGELDDERFRDFTRSVSG